jgi:hypothetical protein
VKVSGGGAALLLLSAGLAGYAGGCGLFEPRSPEAPTQSSQTFLPATDPLIVISNLQDAIEQKSVPNYMQCLADPLAGVHIFLFVPSSEGTAQYGSLFRTWSTAEEQAYFQNLTTRTTPASISKLDLTEKTRSLAADSALLEYDYTLTFENTAAGFPSRASGNLQFALQRSSSNIWTIYRWTDFKTTNDITWSLFKGKFSN